jgi:general secretion pathway protein G
LVELLLVIVIISTLSAMTMLSTGSATDGAESVRVINDLRSLKAASVMFFIDNNRWPAESAADAKSLDVYMDREFLASGLRYSGLKVTDASLGGVTRTLIGVTLNADRHREGIRRKLRGYAENSGLFNSSGNRYNNENDIYVSMY